MIEHGHPSILADAAANGKSGGADSSTEEVGGHKTDEFA
jgi:hypothetical protein